MTKYYSPVYELTEFHCIHCGVFSAQIWQNLYYNTNVGMKPDNDMKYCVCAHCRNWSYWYKKRMVVPSEAPVSPAHHEMPAECLAEYDEARSIVAISPRAAAALLRLVVQKLMVVLGEKGKNLNDDIGKLVGKGLAIQVQQALDFCRVIGNNAVHPGEINLNDTPEIAHNLFSMINYIVEDRVARPKQIQSLYDQLPEKARKAIEERDNDKT